MVYIYKDRIIRVEWTVLKGISNVREDFSRALVKLFLIGNRERYLLEVSSQEDGTIKAEIPQGLEEGTYTMELIYVKNWGNLRRGDIKPERRPIDIRSNDRTIMRTRKDDLFSITEFESEATNVGEGAVVLKVKTSTASYGYDGLSSYELAVLRGDWSGSEGDWLKHQRYVSVLDSRGDSEVDTMSQKAITDELEAIDQKFEDTDKEIEEIKGDIKDTNDTIGDLQDTVEVIRTEAPVSAHPAGFKPDIDLTPEITVDRAWRDHEGNVISDTYITRRGLRNEIIDITNQQVTDLKPGSVDPEDLSEATKQLIGNKSITNLPDEEDITVTDSHTLKLKDKEYAPKDYSGMGRVYLRKHYVDGVNTLTQHMMRKPNTIYIIQYDYCLAGQTIEVPENCVLDFQGGSLRNGTIVGYKTYIESFDKYIFKEVDIRGIFLNKKINCIWFGLSEESDDSSIAINNSIQQAFNTNIKIVYIPYGSYKTKNTIFLESNITLEGEHNHNVNIIYVNPSNTPDNDVSDVDSNCVVYCKKDKGFNYARNQKILNITFFGSNVTTSKKRAKCCIYIDGSSQSIVLEKVNISSASYGVYAMGIWLSKIKSCYFQYNYIGIALGYNSNYGTSTSTTIENTYITHFSSWAIWASRIHYSTFSNYGIDFGDKNSGGIYIRDSFGTNFCGIAFESEKSHTQLSVAGDSVINIFGGMLLANQESVEENDEGITNNDISVFKINDNAKLNIIGLYIYVRDKSKNITGSFFNSNNGQGELNVQGLHISAKFNNQPELTFNRAFMVSFLGGSTGTIMYDAALKRNYLGNMVKPYGTIYNNVGFENLEKAKRIVLNNDLSSKSIILGGDGSSGNIGDWYLNDYSSNGIAAGVRNNGEKDIPIAGEIVNVVPRYNEIILNSNELEDPRYRISVGQHIFVKDTLEGKKIIARCVINSIFDAFIFGESYLEIYVSVLSGSIDDIKQGYKVVVHNPDNTSQITMDFITTVGYGSNFLRNPSKGYRQIDNLGRLFTYTNLGYINMNGTLVEKEIFPIVKTDLDRLSSENKTFTIIKDIDLLGGSVHIPNNCTINFQGGKIINGEIILYNTKILPQGCNILDYITASIKGSYKDGQTLYDPNIKKMKLWNGTEWTNLDGSTL